ncbi:MAG: T9SS C-terminal target domain-containing protein, partial [Runella slithyformis]
FTLPRESTVAIKLVDLTGRLVQTVYQGFTMTGTHTVEIDGTALASGPYLCVMQADGFQTAIRIIRQ